MKNQAKDKKIPKSKDGKTKSSPRKSIEDRDLNEDSQDKETNAEREDDWAKENQSQESAENDVEAEEEREKKRKVEDVHRDEWMK